MLPRLTPKSRGRGELVMKQELPIYPIDEHLPGIGAALDRFGAVIVKAEPGAGKTTRLPPFLGRALPGRVLVLEPRRLAARLSAERVAQESGGKVGDFSG